MGQEMCSGTFSRLAVSIGPYCNSLASKMLLLRVRALLHTHTHNGGGVRWWWQGGGWDVCQPHNFAAVKGSLTHQDAPSLRSTLQFICGFSRSGRRCVVCNQQDKTLALAVWVRLVLMRPWLSRKAEGKEHFPCSPVFHGRFSKMADAYRFPASRLATISPPHHCCHPLFCLPRLLSAGLAAAFHDVFVLVSPRPHSLPPPRRHLSANLSVAIMQRHSGRSSRVQKF